MQQLRGMGKVGVVTSKFHPWTFIVAVENRSKSRSDFQGNEGPWTLGKTLIDVSL